MSQLYVDGIKDRAGSGGPTLGTGVTVNGGTNLNVSGIVTASNFKGLDGAAFAVGDINSSGFVTASSGSFSGNVTIGGTLTYEDVTNVDSVGLVTAQTGVRITAGGFVVTAGVSTFSDEVVPSKGLNVTGITTTPTLHIGVGASIGSIEMAATAGVVTATDFKIGSASVATMGKAIAMAMIFG